MDWRVGIGGALACAAVVVIGVPRTAHACSCSPSSSLLAPPADEQALGAPLVFASTCGGTIEAWSATVAGAPATLVGSNAWAGVHLVTLEPAPAQGDEVVLSVDCAEDIDLPGCVGTTATIEVERFTVGAADTTAPPAPELVTLDLEEGEFSVGCSDDETLDLELRAQIEIDAVEPGTWVEIQYIHANTLLSAESRPITTKAVLSSSHYVERRTIEGGETCVSAVVRDASGNAAPAVDDCAEVVAGCGCNTGTPPVSGLTFVVLAALSRRRRSART